MSDRRARFLVIDPRLLLAGLLIPHGDAAKLLALCAYGRICELAHEAPTDVAAGSYGGGRSWLEARSMADERRARIERVLPVDAPTDLLLVTSPELTGELARDAQRLRGRTPDLRPDVVVRLVNAHAGLAVFSDSDDSSEPPPRTYLLELAERVGAWRVVSDDPELRDCRDRSNVALITLPQLGRDLAASGFEFNEIDAFRVLELAVTPLRAATEAG